jgi:DNA repair protein RadC
VKFRDLKLQTPFEVADNLAPYRAKMKEHFFVYGLSAANKVVYREVVSIGTLTASLVHPREVFRTAIKRCCAGIIVAHNHPSGEPEPSCEDRETTTRLVKAGKLLGIPLLDHVIVAGDKHYSFRAEGML